MSNEAFDRIYRLTFGTNSEGNPAGQRINGNRLYRKMKKANQILLLVLLFLTGLLSSCSQQGKTANKEEGVALGDTIESIVEQLSKETEFHSTEGIGVAGERTSQYDLSDSLWHIATTEQLAYLALSHPSTVVRLSASYGLMKRDPHLAAEIAIKGVLDTAMCEIASGCIYRCQTVSEGRISHLRVNREYYGLSVEDSIRLDSVVLYKPYFDKYDRFLMTDLMERLPPHPQHYERLKDLYLKEHCIYALMGIAKYQRDDDRQLIIDMARRAIRLSQEKYEMEQALMEADVEEETAPDEIDAVAEEDVVEESTCTPPERPSENHSGEVGYVTLKSVSFWPDRELVSAVQPLRYYYRGWYDMFIKENQRTVP